MARPRCEHSWNDERRKRCPNDARRRRNSTGINCGSRVGVCGIQRRGRRRQAAQTTVPAPVGFIGAPLTRGGGEGRGDNENGGGCSRSIADSGAFRRSASNEDDSAMKAAGGRGGGRATERGLNCVTLGSVHVHVARVLCSRARARVTHPRTRTHTRTSGLERSSEPLAAGTFVFRLRTDGRRETP